MRRWFPAQRARVTAVIRSHAGPLPTASYARAVDNRAQLLRIIGVQNFLQARQARTDGGTKDYSSQKCVVIVFRLISVVDAIRDSGRYLTASYWFVPGSEGCICEFHWNTDQS